MRPRASSGPATLDPVTGPRLCAPARDAGVSGPARPLGLAFEQQQVLRRLDVERRGGDRHAHHAIGMALQQRAGAAIAAQLAELTEAPAREITRSAAA